MNVQAVDVCGNDGGDADLCVPCNTPKKQFTKQVPKKWYWIQCDRTGNEPLTLQTEPKGEPDHSATASQDVWESSWANFRYTKPWNLQMAPLKNSLLYRKTSGMETEKQYTFIYFF
jgi:hypothetical protein